MTDIHAHYDDTKFDADRDALLSKLDGITIINAAVDRETSLFAARLAEKYPNIFFTAGVHPENAADAGGFEEWLLPLLTHPRCVGIGEIGLDYHYDDPLRDIQKDVFRRQLDIAVKTDMPFVLHDRDAHADCVSEVLSRGGIRGVFHSYSGSAETAEILVNAGIYISFSGVITFKNAVKPSEACLAVPDGLLLAETDCPYLAPHPFRGSRNDSSYLKYTLEKIAAVRGTSVENIEKLTDANAAKLFGI